MSNYVKNVAKRMTIADYSMQMSELIDFSRPVGGHILINL